MNFDEDGNLFELDQTGEAPQLCLDPALPRYRASSQLSGPSERARDSTVRHDNEIPMFDDDGVELAPAEPFPEMHRQGDTQTQTQPSFIRSDSYQPDEESSLPAQAAAPIRRRTRRPIPVDRELQFRNSDLREWSSNYLVMMNEAAGAKAKHRAAAQARKNAASWVFGTGIGGVGTGLGSIHLPSPLEMFSGDALRAALTGTSPTTAGQKRPRRATSTGHDTDNEEDRRVRPRDQGHDEEIARGLAAEEDGFQVFDDDAIELARRDSAPPLDDFSTQMPWNSSVLISRSQQGSRQGSVLHGVRSSSRGLLAAGGLSSSAIGSIPRTRFSSMERRASRMPSPLEGRGQNGRSILAGAEGEEELMALDDQGGDPPSSGDAGNVEFELHGPAAFTSTQAAAESQTVRALLDSESGRFLEFIGAEAVRKYNLGAGEGEEDVEGGVDVRGKMVTFEELLPPAKGHSKVVAAQGFLHLLTLATRGVLKVRQEAAFGEIEMFVL
jgi:meiotic recombination protein REC8